MTNDSTDKTLQPATDKPESESDEQPFERERYGHHDIAPIFSRDTVDRLEPYAGQEGIAEIGRLTQLATSDEDQTVRGMAFLELLAHICQHDGTGWTMYAA